MRRKIIQVVMMVLAAALLLTGTALAAPAEDTMLRVGLYYGSNALPGANLENAVGSGYSFGYFDDALAFVPLGETWERKVSVVKTQNVRYNGSNYTDDGSGTAVGCYHVQLPGSYDSFQAARQAAESYSGGFPAWIDGVWYARVGNYTQRSGAEARAAELGGASIVGTSNRGVSVVKTGTGTILFQFDGGTQTSLGIMPVADEGVEAVTWFKGNKYYGGFRYERVSGGDLTVVNILSLEDYVRGVAPYEMNNTWPMEALKAQTVCARTYGVFCIRRTRHSSQHFDICNTAHCQVYRGTGGANERTDQAAEETRGQMVWYNGVPAETYYYSCNGGASEDVTNVWSSSANLPYLKGVIDPYEPTVGDRTKKYNWTVTYTNQQLTNLLNSKNYKCASIVDFRVSEWTPTGNVLTITFRDARGDTYSFSKEKVRTLLGVDSIHFTVTNGGTYHVGNGGVLTSMNGVYAVNGAGETGALQDSSDLHVITGSGIQPLAPIGGSGTYTIVGSGWGHSVGMSQWGANAMARQGFTYEDILKFYFTGIDVY